MSSVVRAILWWFTALVIPVQGMAAVVFPVCPPAHHSAMSQASHHHGDSQAASQPHTDQVKVPGGSATQGGSERIGHDVLNCCSATCAMLAMMQTGVAAHAAARSPQPLQPAEPVDLGITPNGLDRPPKADLA